jgi:hypothetical protein
VSKRQGSAFAPDSGTTRASVSHENWRYAFLGSLVLKEGNSVVNGAKESKRMKIASFRKRRSIW